jgi:hypothetical protein
VLLYYCTDGAGSFGWKIDTDYLGTQSITGNADTALTTATAVNVKVTGGTASFVLPAGTFRVKSVAVFTPAAGTTSTYMIAGLSQTSGVLPAPEKCASISGALTGAIPTSLVLPEQIIAISMPTTFYVVAKSAFAVSTLGAHAAVNYERIQ